MTWKIVPPSDADWCVFTIGGKRIDGGTQTDYWYEYVAGDEPTRDEASLFVPPGWEVLEFAVTATPRNPDYESPAQMRTRAAESLAAEFGDDVSEWDI